MKIYATDLGAEVDDFPDTFDPGQWVSPTMDRPEEPSAKPATLSVDLDGIPDEMRAAKRWMLWRWELNRDGKWTKVPRDAKFERNASSTDPATWATFGQASAALSRGDGLGFALGDGWIGVDVDALGHEAEIIALGTYAEHSPRRHGHHAIGRGSIPPGRRKCAPWEMYGDGRYFTVTGHRLEGAAQEIVDATETFAELHALRFAAPEPAATPDAPAPTPSAGLEDHAIMLRAAEASNGAKFRELFYGPAGPGDDDSALDLGLCNLLAFWSGPDGEAQVDRLFRRSARMRPKWDEMRGAAKYGEMTIARAYLGRTEFYTAPSAGEIRHGGSKPDPEPPGTEGGAEEQPRPFAGRSLAGMKTERVSWLWPGRIPLGSLTMLDGDPDVGKTMLLCDIAARVSAGTPWPLEDAPWGREPAGVVFCFVEDELTTTILPRLLAAGADVERIRVFDSQDVVLIPDNLDRLEAAIAEMDAKLLIIDPLLGHLGHGIKSSDDASMRTEFLNHLAALASRRGCAILGNRHTTKASGSSPTKAIHAGMSSTAIGAVARSSMLAAKHPQSIMDPDDDRRLLAMIKGNLTRSKRTLVYQIAEIEDGQPYILWSDEFSEFKNADAVMAATAAVMNEGASTTDRVTKSQLTVAVVKAMQIAAADGVPSELARQTAEALGGAKDRQARAALQSAGVEPVKRADGWVYPHRPAI